MKLVLGITVFGVVLLAQSVQPAFDVATVRPRNAGNGVEAGTTTYPRRYHSIGSLRSLIGAAYGVQDHQISGGPAWVNTELFQIDGMTAGPTPLDRMLLMLQTLLAERFQLTLRRERKEVPIYALVVARNGAAQEVPKFQKTEKDKIGGISYGAGSMRGRMTLARLACDLSPSAGRTVVDRTGLTGAFEINLRWDDSPYSSGPTLFAAVQEQLGLKLDPAEGPMEILTIERAEKPSGN